MMKAVSAWWARFDADDAFSFTTPRCVHGEIVLSMCVRCGADSFARFVRIQDRRLGLPYDALLAAILAYIVGVVIVQNQGYLVQAEVDGVTRLQARVAAPVLPVVASLALLDVLTCLAATSTNYSI
jgi:hypothetical protein